jgi:hypothetical protein
VAQIDRIRRAVRPLLVIVAAASLLPSVLRCLLAAAGTNGRTPAERWLAVAFHRSTEIGLGQMLVGVAALALAVTVLRTSGAGRKYGLLLLAVFAGLIVLRVAPGLNALDSFARTWDAPAGQGGLPASSRILLIAGVAGTALLAAVFYRWVLTLRPDVRLTLFVAAAIFAAGALGVEAVSEWAWYAHGGASLQYASVTLLEEAAESAGLFIFVEALTVQVCAPASLETQGR